jgi:hypothetical protein
MKSLVLLVTLCFSVVLSSAYGQCSSCPGDSFEKNANYPFLENIVAGAGQTITGNADINLAQWTVIRGCTNTGELSSAQAFNAAYKLPVPHLVLRLR